MGAVIFTCPLCCLIDLAPFTLSLQLATVATLLLLALGPLLAYALLPKRIGRKPRRLGMALRAFLRALVTLPLVLPPTVLGYYLLLAFSPNQGMGAWLAQHMGLSLAFSFPGMVLAAVIFGLPFMVNPLLGALEAQGQALRHTSATLGHGPWHSYWRVQLPLARRAIMAAAVMVFAHTIGEFGVLLMVGGNIPGHTRVASIALFQLVEQLNYHSANVYAGLLLAFSFLTVVLVHSLNQKSAPY